MTEQHIDPATPLDRLDMMLVASGLVESRAKAQRLIKAGHVRVDGETITKPSFMVKAGHSELAVDKGDDYVSRGADCVPGQTAVRGRAGRTRQKRHRGRSGIAGAGIARRGRLC